MICENLDQCLGQLIENSKLAVAISLAHAHKSSLISPSEIYCFDESEIIHDYALKFLIRKDFHYLNELNTFIQMTSEGGLIEKWFSNSSIHTHLEHFKLDNRQIAMKHLQGAFLLGFLLTILSFCLLFLERFIYKKMKSHKPHQFWAFIEMLIDPDRHFLLENKWI